MNNIKREERRLYKKAAAFILLLLIAWSIPHSSNGQNIAKHYTSSMEDNGTIYYIRPQSGFKRAAKGSLDYDITYITGNDSATFDFSFYNKSLLTTIDSIVVIADGNRYTSRTTKLFVESKKHKWHYRYAATFSFADLKKIFEAKQPPLLTIHSQSQSFSMKQSQKKWSKNSGITSKIFNLIMLNKSK